MIEIDERVRQHYSLEKELARRILTSSRENRTRVTIDAYNELFSSIPWHPQLNYSAEQARRRLAEKEMIYRHLVGSRADILDIGAGTASWSRYLATLSTGRCVGIDVSKETLVQQADDPPNLELKIMDAVELDFPASSFDVAFSSQLIEHLHPDDVGLHLSAVYRVLREKGVYAFDTPNRLNGPHDVSKYFDEVATGFHLKEWTYRELACELKQAGFRQAQTMILPWSLVKHRASLRSLGTVSVSWVIPGETLVAKVKNRRSRNTLSKWFRVASIYIVAQK